MGLKYFKRFRMEIDLAANEIARQPLPVEYCLVPWHSSLVDVHAETKYESFRSEIDAHVFPCLGDLQGCQRLMQEIARKDGFLPEATWLVAHSAGPGETVEYCGTVQGIYDRSRIGAIQNLGITPMHRGRGIGTSLLLAALEGFRQVGLKRAFLEVTAQNVGAIRLYQRMGFDSVRTVYKAADISANKSLAPGTV